MTTTRCDRFRLPKTQLFGQVFDRLTVIAYAGRKSFLTHRTPQWLCQCRCGKYTVVATHSLKSGHSRGCGCSRYFSRTRHGHAKRAKGLKPSSEYVCWLAMKTRCYNLKCNAYSFYGGRGIRVCDRWLESFDNFIADMGLKPDPSYSLDRKDCNGDYEPNNCQWATVAEQACNTGPK